MPVLHQPVCDWLLDIAKDLRNGVCLLQRVNEQVDMIGHEDVSPQRKFVVLASPIDRFGEPRADIWFGEELVFVIARECQEMDMTRFVVLQRMHVSE